MATVEFCEFVDLIIDLQVATMTPRFALLIVIFVGAETLTSSASNDVT